MFAFRNTALAAVLFVMTLAAGCGGGKYAGIPAPSGASVTPPAANSVIILHNAPKLPVRGGGYWEVGIPLSIWGYDTTAQKTAGLLPRLTAVNYADRVFVTTVGTAWSPGLASRGREAYDKIEYRVYKDDTLYSAPVVPASVPAFKAPEAGVYLVCAVTRIDDMSDQMIGSAMLLVTDTAQPFPFISGYVSSPDATGQRMVESQVCNLSPTTAHNAIFRAVCHEGWGDYSLTISINADGATEMFTELPVGGDVEIVPGTLRINWSSRSRGGSDNSVWTDPYDLSHGFRLGDLGQSPIGIRFAVRPKPYVMLRILGNFTQNQSTSEIRSAEIEVWSYDANGAWTRGAVVPADFSPENRKIMGWFNTAPDTILRFTVKALDQSGKVLYQGESAKSQWWTGDDDVNVAMSDQ